MYGYIPILWGQPHRSVMRLRLRTEDSGLSSLPKHHKDKARLYLRGPICTGSNKSRFKLWWKRTDGDLTGWSSVHLHRHKFAPHSSISAYKCHTLLDIFATFWLPGSHHRLCGIASGCLRHFSLQKILTTKLSMTLKFGFFSENYIGEKRLFSVPRQSHYPLSFSKLDIDLIT